MSDFPEDIFSEPADVDPNTLANGPQLFYGLRYHTHMLKPG